MQGPYESQFPRFTINSRTWSIRPHSSGRGYEMIVDKRHGRVRTGITYRTLHEAQDALCDMFAHEMKLQEPNR